MLVVNGKVVFTALEELVDSKHTALLLIDLQNDYFIPGGYGDKLGGDSSILHQIVPPTKRTLEAARCTGILVVHVQATYLPDHLAESPAYLRLQLLRTNYRSGTTFKGLPTRAIEGTWGWQIIDELTPLPNEIVVKKNRSSAFMGSNLDMILRSNGIRSVVIVGQTTDSCVLSTAKDAGFFDYYPILVRDCIASPRSKNHDAALIILSWDIDVVDSQELIEIWK